LHPRMSRGNRALARGHGSSTGLRPDIECSESRGQDVAETRRRSLGGPPVSAARAPEDERIREGEWASPYDGSNLSVAVIASALRYPGRLVGMHFFNPVHAMKLVEVVTTAAPTGARSSGRSRSRARSAGSRSWSRTRPGSLPAASESCWGSRRCACSSKAPPAPKTSTRQWVGYNHPMGPLKLSDLVGLDVRLAIAEYLWSGRLNRVRCTAPRPLTGL